jgi:hypothetical protein
MNRQPLRKQCSVCHQFADDADLIVLGERFVHRGGCPPMKRHGRIRRRAIERRKVAGAGMHTVHLMAGRVDPDCPMCPKADG